MTQNQNKTNQNAAQNMAKVTLLVIASVFIILMLTTGAMAQAKTTRKLPNVGYDCSQADVKKTTFDLKPFKNSTPEWIERRILMQQLWHENVVFPYDITHPRNENQVFLYFNREIYLATCPRVDLYESENQNCYHDEARPVRTISGREMFLLDTNFLSPYAAQIACNEIPRHKGDEEHAIRQKLENYLIIRAGTVEMALALHKVQVFADLSTAFSPQATSNLITKEVGVSQKDANITCLWTQVALFYRQNSAKIHIGFAVGKLTFNFILFAIGIVLRIPITKAFSLCITQVKKIWDLIHYHQKQRQRTQERLAQLQRQTLGLAPNLTLSELTGDHLETLYEINAHLARRIADLESTIQRLSENNNQTNHPASANLGDRSPDGASSSSPTHWPRQKKRQLSGRVRRTETGIAYRV